MTAPNESRGSWGTRAGFILAAVGSAVGLGNMWRFSYQASEHGGAAFVLFYILIVAAVGIPIMTSEFVVGRLAQQSPAVSLQRLAGRGWKPLGWLFVFCGLGILAYYAVIAGWTMRYAFDAIRNAIPSDTGAYFGEVASGWDAVGWQLAFMVLTIVIVARGVKGGLEKANIVMMPLLFLILIVLAIWAATLPSGGPGYARYLQPRMAELFDLDTLAAAAGQAFFSLSLGMGAMMTYASYLKSRTNLGAEATMIALSDTGVAFTAGLVVFPVIFNFGLEARISESTVGALFIALPAGFEQLGRAGDYVDTAFFVMLFFAALTSSISLLEVVVAAVVDGLGWARGRAAVVWGVIITLIGVPLAFDTDRLGAADQVVGNFLLVVGGFFICLLVGWRLARAAEDELAQGMHSGAARAGWKLFVRFIAPALLLVVMYSGLGATWAAVKTLLGLAS